MKILLKLLLIILVVLLSLILLRIDRNNLHSILCTLLWKITKTIHFLELSENTLSMKSR